MIDLAALAAKAKPLPSTELPPVDPEFELHVDGDYAAYYYSGDDEREFGAARKAMTDALLLVARMVGAGKIIVHLTAGDSDKGRRFDIATVKAYQGQRDSSRRPKNWEGMRTWLEGSPAQWRTVLWHDREADDGVAASARYAEESGRHIAIFSRDKDFRMIPGLHVVWTTFEQVRVRPSDWEIKNETGDVYGQKWFWLQLLQGDAADNIPGLEGVAAKGAGKFKPCGPACAEVRLADTPDGLAAFVATKHLYSEYYGQAWADRFVEQAALLWMRVGTKPDVGDFLKAMPVNDIELRRTVDRLKKRIK